jgi:hypothetical protein
MVMPTRMARRLERRNGATPGYGRRGKTSGAYQELADGIGLTGGRLSVANLDTVELETYRGIGDCDCGRPGSIPRTRMKREVRRSSWARRRRMGQRLAAAEGNGRRARVSVWSLQ